MKDYCFCPDSTPTHWYRKYLYRYPQRPGQADRRDGHTGGVIPATLGADGANVRRQASAGMRWSRQFHQI